MGKEITLPLGMSSEDIDIPAQKDIDHVSGDKYDCSNIKYSDVAGKISPLQSSSLKTLCKHANVNKWAAFQPTQNADVPCNWFKKSGEPEVEHLEIASAYRLGDFAGYNHDAREADVTYNEEINHNATSGTNESTLFVELPEFDIRSDISNITATHLEAVTKEGSTEKYSVKTKIEDSEVGSSVEDGNIMVNYEYEQKDDNYTITVELWFYDENLEGTIHNPRVAKFFPGLNTFSIDINYTGGDPPGDDKGLRNNLRVYMENAQPNWLISLPQPEESDDWGYDYESSNGDFMFKFTIQDEVNEGVETDFTVKCGFGDSGNWDDYSITGLSTNSDGEGEVSGSYVGLMGFGAEPPHPEPMYMVITFPAVKEKK